MSPLRCAQLRTAIVCFFVACEQNDDVTRGSKTLRPELHQADERPDHAGLIVACPAPIEITVLLGELERVGAAVRSQHLDDVHMFEDEQRLCGRWLACWPGCDHR